MSETTKCGTGCITPSVCHPFFCNRRADGGVQPSPSPATPPLAADHAQAREFANLVTYHDPERITTWNHHIALTLARAYLALAAASPGEGREPELDFDKFAHSLAVTFLGLDAVNSPPPKAVMDSVADLLRSLYRTPPAAPAVGVTITEAMVEAFIAEFHSNMTFGNYREHIKSALTAALRGTEG